MTDAGCPWENKQALIDDILGDRANPLTVSLLGFVVDTGRARDVSKIVERLVEMMERTRPRLEKAPGGRADARAAERVAEALRRRQATPSR